MCAAGVRQVNETGESKAKLGRCGGVRQGRRPWLVNLKQGRRTMRSKLDIEYVVGTEGGRVTR